MRVTTPRATPRRPASSTSGYRSSDGKLSRSQKVRVTTPHTAAPAPQVEQAPSSGSEFGDDDTHTVEFAVDLGQITI